MLNFESNSRKHNGVLIGKFTDSVTSGKFDVRFNECGYYCVFKNQTIYAPNILELQTKLTCATQEKRDWIDVIRVTIGSSITNTCPPYLSSRLSFIPQHMAKLTDGTWVTASWSPDIEVKKEQVEHSIPEELTLPYKFVNRYCGSDINLIIPFSDTTIARLKQFQLHSVEMYQDLTAELLGKSNDD